MTEPARVAAGTRVSYVPAAALVVRTEALRAIGGFDETLRVGEDVDAVWRLIDAGYRCRYEPSVVVHHRPRSTLSAWTAPTDRTTDDRRRRSIDAIPVPLLHCGSAAGALWCGH